MARDRKPREVIAGIEMTDEEVDRIVEETVQSVDQWSILPDERRLRGLTRLQIICYNLAPSL